LKIKNIVFSTIPISLLILAIMTTITSTSQQASASFLDNLFGSGYKSYVSSSHNVKIDYPNDWHYEETGHDESSPETIFKVNFISPINTQEIVAGNDITAIVSVSIDELKPSVTLDQYKDRIMNNLKNAGQKAITTLPSTGTVKDLTISTSTLGGEPAYRIEYMMWFTDHWEKSITLYAVKDGKLHEVSALGKSEALEKYSEPIKKMIESARFD
jgi:hypothetical protein